MTDIDLKEHRQFIMNAEHSIRIANKEVMNPIVGQLTEDKIVYMLENDTYKDYNPTNYWFSFCRIVIKNRKKNH